MKELIEITEETLRSGMADSELSKLNKAATTDPPPQRISSIITQTCDKIAGYVNAYPPNPKLATGTNKVPAELVGAAVAIGRYFILANLPDMTDLEGSIRARTYSDAIRQLEDVARGTFHLEPWDDGMEDDHGIQSASDPYQNFSGI